MSIAPDASAQDADQKRAQERGAAISFRSGTLFFGAFVPSFIVARTSDRAADEWLYAPLVGPWLDLAQRGACTSRSGCETEAVYKVLLVANGLAQGAGMLGLFSGILVAGLGTRKPNVTPSVQLAPMIFGKGSMGGGFMGTF